MRIVWCCVLAMAASAFAGACSSGGTKATAPTTTTVGIAVTSPPTTRDPRVHPVCATATHQVVDYIVRNEFHGNLPLGGTVPESELAKPPLRPLVRSSLERCVSHAEWHLAMQNYVAGGADKMDTIFVTSCGVERHAFSASIHIDGAVVMPIPAACE